MYTGLGFLCWRFMVEGSKPRVRAWMVCPTISCDPTIRKELEEDLMCLGCVGLFWRPWNIKCDNMIDELINGAPNQYELTMRG